MGSRPVRVSVLGRPGSGKGTQSARLARVLGVPHISTGELLRTEIERGTPVGRRAAAFVDSGRLVPDDVMQDSLADRLHEDDVQREGFVLDGYPRTIDQAVALESMLAPHDLDAVVELMVPEREAAERLGTRLVCPECGRSVSRVTAARFSRVGPTTTSMSFARGSTCSRTTRAHCSSGSTDAVA
jgi:adenylate kinase